MPHRHELLSKRYPGNGVRDRSVSAPSRVAMTVVAITCSLLVAAFSAAPVAADDGAAVALSRGKVYAAMIPLTTPRKKAPRGGGPLDKVELKLWLPDGDTPIRGVVMNPFYVKAHGQSHWQAACRHWGFGLIGANYFAVKQADFRPSLEAAMREFAKQSSRPEVGNVSFCFVGMSAGGGMSAKFTELMPDRTIAAAPVCLEVGPKNEASCKVPMVTIFGERDGKQMQRLAAKLPEWRAKGAQWVTAVQWLKKHEFAKANNMALPFFDRVIRLRMEKAGKLKPIALNDGQLAHMDSWDGERPVTSRYDLVKGDKSKYGWLPDGYTAAVWRAFVTKKPKVKLAAPKDMGGGNAFVLYKAGQPIDIVAKLSVKATTVGAYAGDKPIALLDVDAKDGKTFRGQVMFKPGVHTIIVVATGEDGLPYYSKPSALVVE